METANVTDEGEKIRWYKLFAIREVLMSAPFPLTINQISNATEMHNVVVKRIVEKSGWFERLEYNGEKRYKVTKKVDGKTAS